MTIDVQITYKSGKITAISKAANYNETRPAIVSLSREAGEDQEKIEAVGELPELILSSARLHRPAGSHTYRFIDPFAKETFDPDCAFAVIRHYCYLAHTNIKPSGSFFRTLVKLDRFEVCMNVAEYSRIAEDKRKQFEKLLRQRFGRVRIEE